MSRHEATPAEWCPHLDERCVDCVYCQGEACHECEIAAATANPRPRCDHDVLNRHHGLPIVRARWRRYTSGPYPRLAR